MGRVQSVGEGASVGHVPAQSAQCRVVAAGHRHVSGQRIPQAATLDATGDSHNPTSLATPSCCVCSPRSHPPHSVWNVALT